MGSLTILSDSTLTVAQQEFLHTAQVCGEQLLYVINDILGKLYNDNSLYRILCHLP